jgi:thiol peroxidase
MAQITLKGNPVHTIGTLPLVGTAAPDFVLVTNNLSKVSLKDFEGMRLVLNIFPSLETRVCAMSVRRFNYEAAELKNTKVLCISRDLPYTQKNFCGTEGINNALSLSDFVSGKFGRDYQLLILDGPMAHLLSRSVIVLDENHRVMYTEQVPEISQEPDYESALASLK